MDQLDWSGVFMGGHSELQREGRRSEEKSKPKKPTNPSHFFTFSLSLSLHLSHIVFVIVYSFVYEGFEQCLSLDVVVSGASEFIVESCSLASRSELPKKLLFSQLE